ncbi:hypothetical protein FOA52_015259 [Chlamydomonas sp. UWO 241]|nr:hypothetical protein FOA52_015259 [Chlamydomonas sp. UWO 241]
MAERKKAEDEEDASHKEGHADGRHRGWRASAFEFMVHGLGGKRPVLDAVPFENAAINAVRDAVGATGHLDRRKGVSTDGGQSSAEPSAGGAATGAASPPLPSSSGVNEDSMVERTGELAITGVAMMRNFIDRPAGELGYCYTRVMERCGDFLMSSPEIRLSMCLEEVTGAETSGATPLDPITAADDEDDEDDGSAAAEPITLPEPQRVLIPEACALLGGKPPEVVALLFGGSESELAVENAVREGLRDVATEPWRAADPSLGKGVKTRELRYIRPLSLGIPMAPKQCNVLEVHTMSVNKPGGFVFEKRVTTDAPKGDTFYVVIQICGTAAGVNTQLRVSYKIEFVKNVGFLKGAIESGALSGTKAILIGFVQMAAKMYPPKADGDGPPPPTMLPSAPTAALGASREGGAPEGTLGSLGSPLIQAVLLCVLLLFGSSAWGMARALARLGDALDARWAVVEQPQAPHAHEQAAVFAAVLLEQLDKLRAAGL